MKTLLFFSLAVVFISQHVLAWEIDFSRREKYLHPQKTTEGVFQQDTTLAAPEKEVQPTVEAKPETPTPEQLVTNTEPAQDIVILNTDKGFIPKSLSLRANVKYRVHVVNVNEKEKNVSFIMSAFSQYQGTYFGQIKSFEVVPPKEGVYTYECPETSQEGRVVVIPAVTSERSMASEK